VTFLALGQTDDDLEQCVVGHHGGGQLDLLSEVPKDCAQLPS